MNFKTKTFSVLFALFSAVAFAQMSVSGTVSDASGNPVPGVAVIVAGTSTGTTTDFDGNYTISVGADQSLVFTSLGFADQTIAVGNQSTIDVVMQESSELLDEIIVTGYGSQTRGNLTGSVGTVDVADAVKVPVVNAAEALQGRVAGVNVVTNGQPGSAPTIRIRGYGTPNNNNPLFIIDGVQTNDPFVLNSINPADIAQMNVLKDGAAAIYGSRASNGVIIVTTKNGSGAGKSNVTFEATYGNSQAVNLPELLNAQQHGEMIWQSKINDGVAPSHPQYGNGASPVIPASLQGAPVPTTVNRNGTDWLGAIFQTAPTQNYNLTIQNSSETGNFLLSANYLERDGIQIETGYERAGTRLNSEFKIGDNIKIGQNLNVTLDKERNGNQVQAALRSSPLIPLRDDNGAFAGIYATPLGLGNVNSPYATLLRAKDNYNKSLRVLGSVFVEADLTDNLTFKTLFGGQNRYFNSRGYSPATPEAETGGSRNLTEQNFNQYEWTWTNTLNYKNTFGKHNVDALAGYESNKRWFKGSQVSRNNFLFETPDFYLLSTGEGTPVVNYATENSNTLASVFGSLSYSFDDKYFLTATVRSDRSSRFAGDQQQDFFPSASIGWVIDKEDFFPESDVLTNLKLRVSYGELGNQELPVANSDVNISSLSEGTGFYSFTGTRGNVTTGAVLNNVGNPFLSWETSVAKNIGLDMTFFNKLTATIEYFDNSTENLIVLDNSLIGTTAIDASPPFVNFGNVTNKGFEAVIAYADQTKSGLSYDLAFNFSTYENEVTSLVNDTPVAGNGGFRGGAVTRTEVGQPISMFYGRVVEGIFASDAEVAAHATQDGAAPGRLKYRDVNGDGVINDNDRDFIGSPHPDFTFGFNMNLAYKNFDLTAFVNGIIGQDIYNYSKIFTDFPTFFNGNRSVRVLDSWTPQNTGASLPALSETLSNSETQPNSFFVEDGSFIRLKTLQLGYNFGEDITNKLGVNNMRLYLSGTNLFTITDYDGLDPEASEANALTIGVDSGRYPLARILSVGLNLNF
jgi:TonB-linked SusC/RagA family outer membrane protein